VDDVIPSSLTGANWTCLGAGASQCKPAGTGDVHDIVALAPSGTVTYTVHATVAAGATGQVANTATVTPPADSPGAVPPFPATPGVHDPNPSNNSATDTDAGPAADLAPALVGPAEVHAGGNISYSLTLPNNGNLAASSATVVVPTPAGTTFISAVQNTGTAATLTAPPVGATGDVMFSTASLAAGGSQTFTIVVAVSNSTPGGTAIHATATASTLTIEPNTANNTASATSTVTAPAGADFVPLVPERLLDTRGPDPIGYVGAKPAAGAVVRVHVTGVGASAVPLDAKAVVFNLTGSEAGSDGFVTAWPCGAAQPNASNLNVTAHANIPNLIISKVGEGGDVCLFTQPSQHLIVDIAGFMPGSSRYVPVTPERLLDSRSPGQIGYVGDKPGTGAIVRLHVTGVGSTKVPGDAAAVVLNVTGTEAGADGYVTVWPCGAAQPTASNLNLAAGASRPNLVIAKIGEGGDVCLFTQSPSHLLADVLGYMPAGTSYAPVVPVRLLDTRGGSQVGYTGDKPAAGAIVRLHVTGDIVPASASAVVLNVTGTDVAADGYVTVWPCAAAQPSSSNLNLRSGETAPNLVIAKIGADGDVCFYTQSSVDLIADVNGYWAG